MKGPEFIAILFSTIGVLLAIAFMLCFLSGSLYMCTAGKDELLPVTVAVMAIGGVISLRPWQFVSTLDDKKSDMSRAMQAQGATMTIGTLLILCGVLCRYAVLHPEVIPIARADAGASIISDMLTLANYIAAGSGVALFGCGFCPFVGWMTWIAILGKAALEPQQKAEGSNTASQPPNTRCELK
jgi:hypothetical protein